MSDKLDVVKFITNYISDFGYGIIDLPLYLRVIPDEVIEDAMNEAKYNYIKLRSGSYMLNLEIFSEEFKQKVIDLVNKCIKENGFNEKGYLQIEIDKCFDLNPASIIHIIQEMGYECIIGSQLGTYIISLPKEEDIELSDEEIKLMNSIQFLYDNGDWNEDGEKTVFCYTDLTVDQIKYLISKLGIKYSVDIVDNGKGRFKKRITIYE